MPGITATPEAVEMIERLTRKHGPLVFFQSGGCCDGTAAICLREGDMTRGPHDLELGVLAGAPFYIDSDQHQRWGSPGFLIDVRPGPAEGFSLEGLEGVHFVSRSPGP